MTEKQGTTETLWEKGWDGHEKAQLLRLLKLSFEEKIRWLEEAQEMIHALQHRNAQM